MWLIPDEITVDSLKDETNILEFQTELTSVRSSVSSFIVHLWRTFVNLSHLHHGPRAKAGPDHICYGLKQTHTQAQFYSKVWDLTNVCVRMCACQWLIVQYDPLRLTLKTRSGPRPSVFCGPTETDLCSTDVSSLHFTTGLPLYVLVCRETWC